MYWICVKLRKVLCGISYFCLFSRWKQNLNIVEKTQVPVPCLSLPLLLCWQFVVQAAAAPECQSPLQGCLGKGDGFFMEQKEHSQACVSC